MISSQLSSSIQPRDVTRSSADAIKHPLTKAAFHERSRRGIRRPIIRHADGLDDGEAETGTNPPTPSPQPPPPTPYFKNKVAEEQEEERDLFIPAMVILALAGYAATALIAWWEYQQDSVF